VGRSNKKGEDGFDICAYLKTVPAKEVEDLIRRYARVRVVAADKRMDKEAFTNLFDAMRSRLNPRSLERMRTEVGVDDKALAPFYPLEKYHHVIKVIAEELYPGRPMDDASYEVGRTLITNYERNVIGKALFAVIRAVGPMRFLKRLPEYYKLNNNYAEVKVEPVGTAGYLLEHNEVGALPHFMRGSMQGAGELLGLKGHAVELVEYDGHRAKFRVTWNG
jgi:uncharacterized protein (TIGR02265 family)